MEGPGGNSCCRKAALALHHPRSHPSSKVGASTTLGFGATGGKGALERGARRLQITSVGTFGVGPWLSDTATGYMRVLGNITPSLV